MSEIKEKLLPIPVKEIPMSLTNYLLRLTEAIHNVNTIDTSQLEEHINNKDNPHHVNKEQLGLDNIKSIKNNISTYAPTSSNDIHEGYSVGSWWLDIASGRMYVCFDNSSQSAVWKSAGGDMEKYDYDTNDNGAVNYSENLISIISAQENVSHYTLMSIDGYIPDSNDISFRNRIAGVAIEDIFTGHSGKVLTQGTITNDNWNFTPNSILFLNAKSISQNPPTVGFIQEIGKAITNTKILVNIKQAIIL